MRSVLLISVLAIAATSIPVAAADCSNTEGTFVFGTATLHQLGTTCTYESNNGTYVNNDSTSDTNTKVSESTTGASVTFDENHGSGDFGPIGHETTYHFHSEFVNVDTPAGGASTGAGYGDQSDPDAGCQEYVYGGLGQVYTKSATCSGLLA